NGDAGAEGNGNEKSHTADANGGSDDKSLSDNPNRSRRTTRQRRVPQPEQPEADKNG
ncbi:MAG: hypothetical protein JHC87_10030, partial [Thermoleophilaceae bacterium]|nr:hypothetical protein [Thermoleophilaceae bacterium]